MSPSGHLLCVLITVISLILPSGGQTLEETTPIFALNTTPGNIHVQDTTSLEVQSTPQTPTRAVDEAAQNQTETETETETQHPTGTDMFLVTDPGTHGSSGEGATPFPRIDSPSANKDSWPEALTFMPLDDDKDNPFTYDNDTLWRRGLLVAAVLFITGIVILTSGKCRKLSQLCCNNHRAYSVVNTRSTEKGEAAGGSQV
uniref:FXYD domain-containing ion transport regulator 5 n=1 Tax=Jaculus jaculus TaxID=51337 RepID=UPI001E1B3CBC|nr:FXYD domain-containing ion transport regulator 5 [Jaculus jaculus]